MTVHTTTNKVQYTGNSHARVWSYTFPCADEDWLQLYVTEGGATTQVLNDYTVDLEDKTVTYPVNGAALTAAQTLTIMRVLPLEQSLDLVNQGALEAEAIEAELDEMVQMMQQLQERLGRCVMAGVAENAPAVDYDALTDAAQLAQVNGTAAGAAAQAANVAAALANSKAGAANTAAQGANAAKDAANSAAAAAQAAAEAVDDYTARAEAAAASAEADAIKAYSNAAKAHEYFCRVWGVCWPFIRWFMSVPILDGKCSKVFAKSPPAGITDGGDIDTVINTSIGIYDGRHSDPLEWIVINHFVTDFMNAVAQTRALIKKADAAQHALELTIIAANDVATTLGDDFLILDGQRSSIYDALGQ